MVEAPDNQLRLYLAPLRVAHVEGRRSNKLETDGTRQTTPRSVLRVEEKEGGKGYREAGQGTWRGRDVACKR